MKPKAKRTVNSISAFLMASALIGGTAHAQEISTSLPLTTVGDELMWAVGDQTLSLVVPASGVVKLELYSPRVDPADYRSDTYFGDEIYTKATAETVPNVSTTFTLVDASGNEVLTRTFVPGQHDWETLIDQELPAGQYKLRAQTQGNGKNTFALRLSGVSASISADQLSVNVHSQDWVPALSVTTDGTGYALRMYDGDGAQELEARLRDAEGNVQTLTVSGDLTWSDLKLPDTVGQYVVELRQPTTAKQYSNTVSFGLTREGTQTPITVSRVDQTGQLRVTAELLLPTGAVPTTAEVQVSDQTLQVENSTQQTVPAGEYEVKAAPVVGAEVQVDKTRVTVPQGGVGDVQVQIKPTVALTLQADKPQVCVGDTLTLTARASTAFSGDLPLDLKVDAPGLTLSTPSKSAGTLNAARAGELVVKGTVTQAGPLTITANLGPWGQSKQVEVEALPAGTSLQLSRSSLADAQVGDEVEVRLSVTNTASQPVPFTLKDQTPAGLKALGSTSFEGTLAAGETRELSYRAEVLTAGESNWQAQLDSPACPAPQQVAGRLNVAAPAPIAERQSTISLPFDVPRQAVGITIAQKLPAGATFVAGSGRLDGKPVPDPMRGPSGTLYWTVPAPTGNGTEAGAAVRGLLTYDVTHTDALGEVPAASLQADLSGNRTEVLQGQIDVKDLQAAARPKEAEMQVENEGAIKLPMRDAVIRVRDRISVTVEAPQGPIPTLTVNGQAVSADTIGTNTQDGVRKVQRLTFVGVPLKAGENVLRFLDSEVKVYLVGATAKIELTPIATQADGSSPVRIGIKALDAFGKLTTQPTVTLNTSLEPRTPDANPSEPGYQVRLTNGEGVLELQPQSSPATLKVSVLQGDEVANHTYEIKPDKGRVGVAVASVTVGIDGNFQAQDDVKWQARGYYEGPVGAGKLYAAADKDGLPTDRNTLIRNTVYGDASTESVPLQGIDPVALSYDHPNFRVEYRRNALPVDVLPVGEQLTALTGYSKTNPQVSGFVALVPEDRVMNKPLTPDGTRVLHLGDTGILLGSDSLELVTTENVSGKEIKRERLTRNVDYVLDARSGVVTFSRPVSRVDANFDDQMIYASYRLDNPMGKRRAVYGAQVKVNSENGSVGAAVVNMDGNTTYGVRGVYQKGELKATALVAYSGGVQASADVNTVVAENHDLNFRVRYQQESYQGLAPFTPGLVVGGKYTGRLTPRLGVVAEAEYRDLPTRNADALVTYTRGGNVTARAVYKIAPFTVGAGATYGFGDRQGFGLVGSVGYDQGPVTAEVVHTQPVTGNLLPTTDINAKFRVRKNMTLGFSDKFVWGVGHAAALTMDSAVGNVNYAVGYELPTASGAGNRARFGATTTLPLGDRTALSLRGNALYDITRKSFDVSTGADVNYKTDRMAASVGGDVAYATDKGFGVVLRGGITGSVTDELTLNAAAMTEFGQGRNGQRAEIGYAYRSRNFSSLGYGRYVAGSLAGGQPELTLGINAEYRQPTWAVRGGVESRTDLNDKDSFTIMASLGGTAYIADRFSVGAWGRMLSQPATSTTQIGYGVEAGVRALPGTWLNVGYNIRGFDGFQSAAIYTRQGAYIRADLTIDEQLGKAK